MPTDRDALFTAARSGAVAHLEHAVQVAQVDVDAADPDTGLTALCAAAENGQQQSVAALLRLGADASYGVCACMFYRVIMILGAVCIWTHTLFNLSVWTEVDTRMNACSLIHACGVLKQASCILSNCMH